MTIQRFSSRRERLDKSFLTERLRNASSYDRIAGYFNSSLLELAGEALETITGPVRVIANSQLDPDDILVARAAANAALRAEWTTAQPENLLDLPNGMLARERFKRLFDFLHSGKLEVRVLPDEVFGLIHGKAGVIRYADGSATTFLGSVNESKRAWRTNYELLWEDRSDDAITWVQEEFDALWTHPLAIPLPNAIVQDVKRISKRVVVHSLEEWQQDAAPAVVETPVSRQGLGLWAHQKYFVKTVFEAHKNSAARFVLADQVGLGKTVQLGLSAQLIALTSTKPILVICPKTLIAQWQTELHELLNVPCAVWNGKAWVDEHGITHPTDLRNCPRRIGIVSSGLISRGSANVQDLKRLEYELIIVDEAHRARRKNLGPNRDDEKPDQNNLLGFLCDLAARTKSMLLATATPVQLRPIEAWDLLDVLSRGTNDVLGNPQSYWHTRPSQGLQMAMGKFVPEAELERWQWYRNPLPQTVTTDDVQAQRLNRDLSLLRRALVLTNETIAPADAHQQWTTPDWKRFERTFPEVMLHANPFITRIVRRSREYLEQTINPETNEPFLKAIRVRLRGEDDADAIRLPSHLREAYELAEEFCTLLSLRIKSSGFLKTLLLRRLGSSISAGRLTAERMLQTRPMLAEDLEEEDEDFDSFDHLTSEERNVLERFVETLTANHERDPKFEVVLQLLRNEAWLSKGCIIFSQYRDSMMALLEYLSEAFPEETIALYSGASTSGSIKNGVWTPRNRDELKRLVRSGELRLMLGTDAASEGLNLQRLGRLINLDLPWNPTKLEQRKGRIQRIGQVLDEVEVYNLRYKDSVEDRVHHLLSVRLEAIHSLFGQLPDILEDVWIQVALGQVAEANRTIDAIPKTHPFEARYSRIENVDWETCTTVLSGQLKTNVLKQPW